MLNFLVEPADDLVLACFAMLESLVEPANGQTRYVSTRHHDIFLGLFENFSHASIDVSAALP